MTTIYQVNCLCTKSFDSSHLHPTVNSSTCSTGAAFKICPESEHLLPQCVTLPFLTLPSHNVFTQQQWASVKTLIRSCWTSNGFLFQSENKNSYIGLQDPPPPTLRQVQLTSSPILSIIPLLKAHWSVCCFPNLHIDSGPLCLLIPLPGMLFTQITASFTLLPPLHLCSNVTLSMSSSLTLYLKLKYHHLLCTS